MIKKKKKNINSIIDVLEKNNLIDDTAAFEHYLPKHKNGVDMGRKVPDLFDYLKDTGQTFEYLREHPLDLD